MQILPSSTSLLLSSQTTRNLLKIIIKKLMKKIDLNLTIFTSNALIKLKEIFNFADD